MPARDNPRDDGAITHDSELEELLRKAAQHFEASRKQILKAEPSAEKKRASAA